MKTKLPLISIGVATFDRVDLLKETLTSIQRQNFSNFEVIVSNDNPKRVISAKNFGINDRRFKFINQKNNLGEVRNMNYLLKTAKGKYFSWSADDDIYHPNFLRTVMTEVINFSYPVCVFTSFQVGKNFRKNQKIFPVKAREFTGKNFLKKYLDRSIRVIGCYGIFIRKYLLQIKGIKQLGTGFSPYADNLLALQCGLLKQVIFINSPLIYYRIHQKGLSSVSPDLKVYYSAQKALINKAKKIFRDRNLRIDYSKNLFMLLCWFIGDFHRVIIRAKGIKLKMVMVYLNFLFKNVFSTKKHKYYFDLMVIMLKTFLLTTVKLLKLKYHGAKFD